MIRLRPAEPQDEFIFWQLRLELQPDLKHESHLAWWNQTWEHRYLAYDGPAFVGVIRISNEGEGEGQVHLQVAKKEQKKGFGTQMLETIQRVAADLGFTVLSARVRRGNMPSQKAFDEAGFEPVRFEVSL